MGSTICAGRGQHRPLRPRSLPPSLDWPLSRDEKKACVLHLYDQDAREREYLLQAYARRERQMRREQQQSCLQQQLDEVGASFPLNQQRGRSRSKVAAAAAAIGEARAARAFAGGNSALLGDDQDGQDGLAAEAVEHLCQALSGAATALGALLLGPRQITTDDQIGDVSPRPVLRARSEGAAHEVSSPALRKTGAKARRHSRGGVPLRVSFSSDLDSEEPEPQPSPRLSGQQECETELEACPPVCVSEHLPILANVFAKALLQSNARAELEAPTIGSENPRPGSKSPRTGSKSPRTSSRSRWGGAEATEIMEEEPVPPSREDRRDRLRRRLHGYGS